MPSRLQNLFLFSLILSLWLASGAAFAQPSDKAELKAFLDGVMSVQLETHHIPGAVVAVVKDGELFFSKGYGYADLASKRPVDPETTLFRIGSTSKLFTYTAVVQLLEAGKLELNQDVNSYLTSFQVPATFPQPVTLAHLLTHTAGFEDRGEGLFSYDEKILQENLANTLPARVRPPGELSAYSNHGVALAGQVVAEVSGLPWETYVEENILSPLGMTHTTPRQPVPEGLIETLSKGYGISGNKPAEKGFEYVSVAPAGSISASANDMAKFMLAHLQGGRYDGAQLMQPETAEQMHDALFRHDPRVNGIAHGFIMQTINAQELIGHGGDTFWFHTELALLPEHGLGVFVSYNGASGSLAKVEFLNAFMDHYFPSSEIAPPVQGTSSIEPSRFVGTYAPTRMSFTTPEKLAVLGQALQVAQAGKDGLELTHPYFGTKTLAPLENDAFIDIDSGETVVFQDDTGKTHAFISNFPTSAFSKLAWFETPALHSLLLSVAALLFLSTLVLLPFSLILNRKLALNLPLEARAARWLAAASSMTFIVFMVLMVMAFMNFEAMAFGTPAFLTVAGVLPYVGAVLSLGVLIFAVVVWARGFWNIAGRLHYTLVALAMLTFIWQLSYWNFLPFPA